MSPQYSNAIYVFLKHQFHEIHVIKQLVLLHSFVQKWLVWDFERKRVGDYGLVYQYFILIEC